MKAHSWICLLLSCKCNHFHCSAIMRTAQTRVALMMWAGWARPVLDVQQDAAARLVAVNVF